MHEPSFLAGLELGKFLSSFSRLESRVDTLDQRVDTIEARSKRFGILAALWTFALLANLSSEKAAEFAVEVALSVLKR